MSRLLSRFFYDFDLRPSNLYYTPMMDLNSDDNFGLDYLNDYSELQNFWEEWEVHDFLSQVSTRATVLLRRAFEVNVATAA